MKPPQLDLHGIRHEEVAGVLHKFIWKNWAYKDALLIITGHSGIMKKIVKDHLKVYAIRRIEDNVPGNWGIIKVWLDN